MTEKRFYYNTFYHADDMSRVMEYEIIDRQSYPNYPNHDEKEDIPQWCIYIGENDSGWQDMLIDLLNGQDKRITNLTRKLTDTTRYTNQLIHLIEDYCEKHYDDMTLQSKIDFGKILKHLGWEETMTTYKKEEEGVTDD